MTGGLMQLVACGAQDIFLTGSPMISYFKTVYRRHTNFAIETIKQTFDVGQPGFGSTVVSTLSRNGDLVTAAYLQASLPDLTEKAASNFSGDVTSSGVAGGPGRRYVRWVDNIGHYLIKTVEVSIGGSVIDRHYSDWLEIWAQLTIPSGKMAGYRKMIGQDPKNAMGQNTGLQADVLSSLAQLSDDPTKSYSIKQAYIVGRDIFIPLQFWFCRNIGLALPLIALQYHEVRIHLTFRSAEDLIQVYSGDSTSPTWVSASDYENYVTHQSLSVNLWVDYVFLDADERRRFAQVSHEYLIEQVQYQEDTCVSGANKSIALNFNHPVKELLWVAKGFESMREWSNFTDTQLPEVPPFQALQIQNNQLNEGLTGLPTETYIPKSKLSLTITTDINITGQIVKYFTVIPTAGYVMTNGDIITINANGDITTNVTLAVVSTVDGVATSFYTKDILTRALTYNKVVNITRFKDFVPQNAQEVNISIKTDRVLTGGVNATTTGITVFTVSFTGLIFNIDDTIYMTSSSDAAKQLILRVTAVTAAGAPTAFNLLTSTVANNLYDVTRTISKGSIVETNPYISINIFNGCGIMPPGETDVTKALSGLTVGSVLSCVANTTINSNPNDSAFRYFILPYGFSMKVGDVIAIGDTAGNFWNTITVLELAGDNVSPIKFSQPKGTWLGGENAIVSYILRDGNVVNDVDVTKIKILPSNSLPNTSITNYYVSPRKFNEEYKPLSYKYAVGDIITMGTDIESDLLVNSLDSLGLPSSVTLLNTLPYTYQLISSPISNVKKITRNGVSVLRNDLIINLRSKTPIPFSVGGFINSLNTKTFFVQAANGYIMSIGDVIVAASLPYLFPTPGTVNPRSYDISLLVSKVENGIATEFQIIAPSIRAGLVQFALSFVDNFVQFSLTKVISITAANTANSVQINLLSSTVLMPDVQNNLSDIKTYDDLMRFSNYDSVRPYNAVTGSLAGNPISKAGLIMNRTDRFLERPGTYFSLVQPRNHHTNIPVSPGINIYSFALNPEEHQPSGSCNFSRIEDATLRIKTGNIYSNDDVKPNASLLIKIFAVSYNILRIVNGMGGLAYN
jgi:hypothetical protein